MEEIKSKEEKGQLSLYNKKCQFYPCLRVKLNLYGNLIQIVLAIDQSQIHQIFNKVPKINHQSKLQTANFRQKLVTN